MSDFKKTVAEIKAAYDIADYMQQAGIALKQRGNRLVGLCFSHQEKTGSLTVDQNFQNYRCFGCGIHGDIFSFVENYEHLDFMEAVKKLADDKGIEIEAGSDSHVDYKSLRACIREAANFYVKEFRSLPADHIARKEIKKRGLPVNGKMVYGYAPEGRNTLAKFLKSKGFSDDTILGTGVCRASKDKGTLFDFWQGRLMFFIADISGRPIGFSGRKLFDDEKDKMGKYVNSSDGPLFDKSNSLFNLHIAKDAASKNGSIYVCEGQFDVASFVESGRENVVASSGTAFTVNQAMICRRLVTENGKIVFCFDGDSAGTKAAIKVFHNVPIIHLQSYAVGFPKGMDPCDYRMENGEEGLLEYVDKQAVPLVEFVLNALLDDYDLSESLDRSKYVNEAARILKTITNAPLRENYIRRVSLDSLTRVEDVREVVNQAEPISPKNYSPAANSEEDVEKEAVREYEVVETEKEDDVSLDDFSELIESHELYSVCAKLVYMSILEPRFSKSLVKLKDYFPKEFNSLITDFEKFAESGEYKVLIPELFERTDLARHITEQNLFPLLHLMSVEQLKSHFKYLSKYLMRYVRNNKVMRVQRSIARALDGAQSTSSPVDLLEKALRKEKQLLEQQ